MAQTGRANEVTNDMTMSTTLIAFLLVFSKTGCVMLAELGSAEAWSEFEQVLIRGSDNQGVINRDEMTVQRMTDTMSVCSITSWFRLMSSYL